MDTLLRPRLGDVSIHPLRESELDEADRIFRHAFGTFLSMPDPQAFMDGADLVRARWRANPAALVAAEVDGAIAGTNCASDWGSVGFLGPLTIRPELWDRGIGTRLMEAALDLFAAWDVRHVGLFTFPHSPKHIGLYQKFGFWPRSLTAVMRKRLAAAPREAVFSRLSEAPEVVRAQWMDACFEVSDSIHAGLDLRGEIRAVLARGTGDALLLWTGDRLAAFAVCHCGPGSEAERGHCYVKAAMCRPGPRADAIFADLLAACGRFAADRGAEWLVAGVNTARRRAYRAMLADGFRPQILGVVMHRPDEPGYDREDVFLIDDWR